jgi:LssY C-terminus
LGAQSGTRASIVGNGFIGSIEMKYPRWIALCLCFAAATLVWAQNPPPAIPPAATQYEVNVSAAPGWTDTHVDLHSNDVVQVTAVAASGGCNAQGLQGSTSTELTMPAFPAGTLIGKLADTAAPFVIGSGRQTTILEPGHLFLAMNGSGKPPCEGSLQVKVQLTPAYGTVVKSKLNTALQTWLAGQFGTGVPQPATSKADSSSAVSSSSTRSASASSQLPLHVSDAALDPRLAKDLDALPRCVSDEFNNLGDMVNFVIIGPQEELLAALSAADWHLADESKEAAIVSAVLQTYEKKDYVQMPMSTLYLFKRPQDFGYEQAEAYSVVASRHHFRVWKAPFTWNGRTVWIGAGTHDIGFEKDQRNGKVTHKIDPAVDGERDHVGETLQKTGKVKAVHYYLPSMPVLEAKNATGGSYHSDGRLLVLFLK